MADMREFSVKSMPHAYVSEDAALIQMEFKDASGESIKLSFDSAQFEVFSNRAIQLFTHTRNQKLAIGDHFSVQPVGVEVAAADAAVGGGTVILALRSDNDLIYHFALKPDEAERLRPQLFRAAKSATKQASQPRN